MTDQIRDIIRMPLHWHTYTYRGGIYLYDKEGHCNCDKMWGHGTGCYTPRWKVCKELPPKAHVPNPPVALPDDLMTYIFDHAYTKQQYDNLHWLHEYTTKGLTK
jgi:hypothetical protein